MKVAHVINSLNRGGAESHLLELVTAQSNNGFIVDVIVNINAIYAALTGVHYFVKNGF